MWYEQTQDAWGGAVRHKNVEVFALLEPAKEKLIDRYKWVLEGLHAGEFDEIIKKHLDSRKKSTTQEPTGPK